MTFEKMLPDVLVNCTGEDYKRFKSSAAFRLDAICKARKFAHERRVGTSGEIVFLGGSRVGPFASFKIDPDGVFRS